ncbi:MAG: BAX inhibitor (BI)-1/YccA family protein, partial [Bacteroidetes bacterium]
MNILNNTFQATQSRDFQGEIAKNFISNVFSWMGIALGLTALTAYYFGTDMELISLLVNENGGFSTLGWAVTIAPFGLVLLMSLGYNKLSYTALVLVFGVYSILMGMSLSFILLIYTAASIFKT